MRGWCVGAIHQSNNELKTLNLIEKITIQDAKMEKAVNNSLKNQYKKLFNKGDKLVYLKAPNFNHIFSGDGFENKK